MALRIVAGTANPGLARTVTASLGCEPEEGEIERFPDGELRPVVRGVRGEDVYVLQPTSPPVNEHLVELLLLLDACRRAGARRVTAVVPYFGYARQDRRNRPGESIGARLAADVITAAGANRVVVVDPHTSGFEATWPIPVLSLSALPVLADALGRIVPGRWVVVAPDLGAVKLAERFAARLRLPVALVRKVRTSATCVSAEDLVGDVEDRRAIIVDDMIATGATIETVCELLAERGAHARSIVACTHGLFVGNAHERLGRLGLERLVVTDTVACATGDPALEVCSVAPMLSDAIRRLSEAESVDDLEFPG